MRSDYRSWHLYVDGLLEFFVLELNRKNSILNLDGIDRMAAMDLLVEAHSVVQETLHFQIEDAIIIQLAEDGADSGLTEVRTYYSCCLLNC